MLHADRKKVTWEHLYKNIYKKDDWSFWGLLNFEEIDNNGCIIFKAECDIEWTDANEKYREFARNHGKEFKISGDADFGDLKNNKCGCDSFIPNAEAEMHKFPNFSLMPCTGSMNVKKGQLNSGCNDRFHTFIYVLSEYYEIKKEKKVERREYVKNELFFRGRLKNEYVEDYVDTLNEFLTLFDNIYDYCDKMYHLNGEEGRQYVEKLIRAGEAIKTGKKEYNVEEYCNLATEYSFFPVLMSLHASLHE